MGMGEVEGCDGGYRLGFVGGGGIGRIGIGSLRRMVCLDGKVSFRQSRGRLEVRMMVGGMEGKERVGEGGKRMMGSRAKRVMVAVYRVLLRFSAMRRKRLRYMRMAKMCMLMPMMLAAVANPPTPVAITAGTRLWRVFTSSFGVVFFSGFGDKSMFATALMAMRYQPAIVLTGALVALTFMTIIACFLGQLGQYLPTVITHYTSIFLFAFFGLQMLLQARDLPDKPGVGGEAENAVTLVNTIDNEDMKPGQVLAKVCSLIFVAEWLDRSMLATMALAASGKKTTTEIR